MCVRARARARARVCVCAVCEGLQRSSDLHNTDIGVASKLPVDSHV